MSLATLLAFLLTGLLPIYAAVVARNHPDRAAKALGAWAALGAVAALLLSSMVGFPSWKERTLMALILGIWGWIAYKVWNGVSWALVCLVVLSLIPLFDRSQTHPLQIVWNVAGFVAIVFAVTAIISERARAQNRRRRHLRKYLQKTQKTHRLLIPDNEH